MVDCFNLLDEPWIRVTRLSGEPDEVSLVTAFEEASDISGICGEIASQDVAILRLLLAIAHRAMGGPKDIETWETYWNDPELLAADAVVYLERYRERFDVRDPVVPFFQVADLCSTSPTEFHGLEELIADVPKKEKRLFTTRSELGLDSISWSEAARWLVHLHAYDIGGVHSPSKGDPRVKGNKSYGIGPGWLGQIGAVHIQGETLFETIMLNTVVVEVVSGMENKYLSRDLPPWERDSDGPGGLRMGRPSGPVSTYTWQSRRVRLYGGEKVTHLFFTNGDEIDPKNMYLYEPMAAYQSSNEGTKDRSPGTFLPYIFTKDRAVWRGLLALVVELGKNEARKDRKRETKYKKPGVVDFYQQLLFNEIVPGSGLVPVHCVGVEYGTQKACVDELIDDTLKIPGKLLEKDNARFLTVVRDAMKEADNTSLALRTLGESLAKAQGADLKGSKAACEQAATSFYLVIDEEFPRWLVSLADERDLDKAMWRWRERLRRIARSQCNRLVDSVGPSAYAGRLDKKGRVDVGISLKCFEASIRKTLPIHPFTRSESKKD